MKLKKLLAVSVAGILLATGSGFTVDTPLAGLFSVKTVEAATTMASYGFKTNVYYGVFNGGTYKSTYGDAAGVKRIQRALNKAFGIGLKVDGLIGTNTHNAIVAFQGVFGLTVDGKVGVGTWNKLKAYE